MKKHFYLLIINILLFIGCKNATNKIEKNTFPKIEFLLKSSDSFDFYVFKNFKDNEKNIKYLFDYISNKKGVIWILTDRYGVDFDGRVFNSIDTTKQRFSFYRERGTLKTYSIYVNILQNIPILFNIKEAKNQKKLTANFDSLTVNTIQNFLDYAEKDETKKETETYSYMLLNKNNREKMKLIYLEYGKWFEVEVL